jgi:hypothetical protein
MLLRRMTATATILGLGVQVEQPSLSAYFLSVLMAHMVHMVHQVLEVMWEDDVSLCLTPQAFSNIHPSADIWNNINLQVTSRSQLPIWPWLVPFAAAVFGKACIVVAAAAAANVIT